MEKKLTFTEEQLLQLLIETWDEASRLGTVYYTGSGKITLEEYGWAKDRFIKHKIAHQSITPKPHTHE